MKPISLLTSALVFLTVILSGCSNDDRTRPNVTLKSMSASSTVSYQAGQYIDIDFVTYTQVLTTEHVGVTFMLIERSKVAELETRDEPDGYLLGEHYIEQLQPGEQEHTARILLPNEELTPGAYVIAAYVDASGVITTEVYTDDNKSRGIEMGDSSTYALITIAEGKHHEFHLERAKVGDGFAMFPGPGKRETESTGAPREKVPDLIGFVKASKLGDEVNQAEISATITIGDANYHAHFWNETTQTYGERMPLVFPDHEQTHFFPWDIAVNGVLLKAIHDDFDREAEMNSFSITFTIHDLSEQIESDLENNSLTIEVPYVLYRDELRVEEEAPQQPTEQALQYPSSTKANLTDVSLGSWSATYGDNDVVAISPSFYSYMAAKSANGGSAEAVVQGDLDLYLFDKSISLIDADADAAASVSDGTIDYSAKVSVLGSNVVNEGDTLAALDESFSYGWSEEQKLVSATFTIVIVPVTVEAGVSGSIDFTVGLSYGGSRIDLGGDIIDASLNAYATAEINLAVASGGVGVDFLIISDVFNVTTYADLSRAFTDSEITFGIDITNDIEAISGEFYLYVKYPVYKWCCKIKNKTKTMTLYETGLLYDKSWTILSESTVFSF